MTTILYPGPLFGPVHSRRLGLSLGINLMPSNRKICSFDCIYCECGINKPLTAPVSKDEPGERMPSREEVCEALIDRLLLMKQCHRLPDSITFSGNGEPTGHPDFPAIIRDVVHIRDCYAPESLVSVLTNASHLDKPGVFQALLKIDKPMLKLDTVDAEYIRRVDRPNMHFDPAEAVRLMASFNGRCMIQTMFLEGEHEGKSVSNTSDKYVLPWLRALEVIHPEVVAIYTLDRCAPYAGLRKANKETLDSIAARVRSLGLSVTVGY